MVRRSCSQLWCVKRKVPLADLTTCTYQIIPNKAIPPINNPIQACHSPLATLNHDSIDKMMKVAINVCARRGNG
jgi:hypothetical protein